MAEARGKSWRIGRQVARWARSHLTQWVVVAVPLDAALITLVSVLIALPDQSPANVSGLILALVVLLVLSVVFPVAGEVAKKREERAKQEQARRERIDRMLRSGSSKRLPRLSELTDADLGATRTQYSAGGNAPYVTRGKADGEIRRLLAEPGPPYPFVIVWGTTKAGKSRTLAEALRTVFEHDPTVIVPRSGQALAELARLGIGDLVDHRPAVVVLDDLDPAGLETLTTEVLQEIRKWAVIAATMTAQRRADVLGAGSGVGVTAQAALEAASGQYQLTSGPPSGAERMEAKRLYPREHFVGSVAETLAGARELVARYDASQDSDPAGCAVVRAAIDARRAGLARPVTEAELQRLFPRYLHAVRIDLDPTSERFAEGIRWATRPVASQVALLRPTGRTGEPPEWIIFDHAVTADEGNGGSPLRPIPSETWAELIDILPKQDTFSVGMAASARNESAVAISAFRKAATSGDDIVAPAAALNLGVMLSQNGDVPGAEAAYRQAIASRHRDAAPGAALGLGDLLMHEGDVPGAEAAYREAIASGHPFLAPVAALRLGNLLEQKGDVPGAEAAYRQAINSGRPGVAEVALTSLGVLLDNKDDVEGARVVYQQIINSGSRDDAASAALNLGSLLRRHDDMGGAEAAYRKAIEFKRPDVAELAARALGVLLYNRGDLLMNKGDVSGAKAAYQEAIASGDPSVVPTAWLAFGILLIRQGDAAGARAALQRAIDSGDANAATTSAAQGLLDTLD